MRRHLFRINRHVSDGFSSPSEKVLEVCHSLERDVCRLLLSELVDQQQQQHVSIAATAMRARNSIRQRLLVNFPSENLFLCVHVVSLLTWLLPRRGRLNQIFKYASQHAVVSLEVLQITKKCAE